jgi:hypothetical protein
MTRNAWGAFVPLILPSWPNGTGDARRRPTTTAGQTSYSFVVQIMSKRDGYNCSEKATEFLADRNGQKFVTPKQGRHIVCDRSFDWNTPPIACSWRLSFNASAIENDSVQDLSISVYQACH